MIHREDRNGVAVIRIDHGKANTLDAELLQAIARELEAVEHDRQLRALVLTGSNEMFSAGVDLFRFLDGGDAYLDTFFHTMVECFRRLFQFARPVVAAVNGHAIAGGCVLAAAADYRVMGRPGGTIGVPALKVAIPFPTAAIEILRFATSTRHLQQLVYLGRSYAPEEAREVGLVDELVEHDTLRERALEVAEQLGSMPEARFGITKRQLRTPSIDRIERSASTIDPEVLAGWKAPETHAALRAYVESRGLGK
jgi:enoyl-CoA hydratase